MWNNLVSSRHQTLSLWGHLSGRSHRCPQAANGPSQTGLTRPRPGPPRIVPLTGCTKHPFSASIPQPLPPPGRWPVCVPSGLCPWCPLSSPASPLALRRPRSALRPRRMLLGPWNGPFSRRPSFHRGCARPFGGGRGKRRPRSLRRVRASSSGVT